MKHIKTFFFIVITAATSLATALAWALLYLRG
jgi:hypothetical protein